MYHSTCYITISILFILVSFIEADDTITCTQNPDCTGGFKCMKDVPRALDNSLEMYCVNQCVPNKVAEQCGDSETCELKKDVNDVDFLTCVKSAECINDNYCEKMNSQKPICNLYTLKCVEKEVSTTTTSTTARTTTKTLCRDLIVGGRNDCQAHAAQCKDPIWLDLMKSKCPKTCGYCDTTSGGTIISSGCVDLSPKCPNLKHLCKNLLYRNLMKQQCQKTCGYC